MCVCVCERYDFFIYIPSYPSWKRKKKSPANHYYALEFLKKSLFVCQTNFLPFSLSFFLGPPFFLLCFVGRVLGEDLRCLVCLIYIIISFDYFFFFLLCVCYNDGCFFFTLLASRRLSLSLFSLLQIWKVIARLLYNLNPWQEKYYPICWRKKKENVSGCKEKFIWGRSNCLIVVNSHFPTNFFVRKKYRLVVFLIGWRKFDCDSNEYNQHFCLLVFETKKWTSTQSICCWTTSHCTCHLNWMGGGTFLKGDLIEYYYN